MIIEMFGPPISLVVLYKEMILYSCAFVKTQTNKWTEHSKLNDQLGPQNSQSSVCSNNLNDKLGSKNSPSSLCSTNVNDQVSDVFAILLEQVIEGKVKSEEKIQLQFDKLSVCRDELSASLSASLSKEKGRQLMAIIDHTSQ
jgi:hypothetical protein